MSGQEEAATALAGLDARAWAQLLRTLRRIELPTTVGDALARPAGELSAGPARRDLCDAIASSEELLTALREDDALPAAVHRAIEAVPRLVGDGTDAPLSARARGDAGDRDPDPRRGEREQALRRELGDERRRREGAEARAAAALARVDELTGERDRALTRIAELEDEVAGVQGAIAQAAARAERRAAARVEQLERDLAAERRASQGLRRELERSRAELGTLTTEVTSLRARPGAPSVPTPASERQGRPLVLPGELEEGTTEAARWFAARVRLLLVDGYNAALLLRPNRPLEEQRRWLVDRLRPLAARGAPTPVVVFDGDRPGGTVHDSGGVEVRFSPSGVLADDEIVFAVAATDEPVLVVTDDVELSERVRVEGGNVVGSVHLVGIADG